MSTPTIDDADFLKMAEERCQTGPHQLFWKDLKKEYAAYKKFFQTVFIEPAGRNDIFHFRATYLRTSKPIWRDIEINGWQTLEMLAEAIIDAMGWNNDHLHSFAFSSPDVKPQNFDRPGFRIMIDFEEGGEHPEYTTDKVLISHLNYQLFPRIRFEFDFGDNHEFNVDYKGQRTPKKNKPPLTYPELIDQRGVAPEQYPEYEEDESISPEEAEFFDQIVKDMDDLARGVISHSHDKPESTADISISGRE